MYLSFDIEGAEMEVLDRGDVYRTCSARHMR